MNLQHNMQVSERIASHRAAGPRPGGCGLVGLGPSMALPLRSAAFKSTLSARSYRHRRIAAAASPSGPGGPSSGDQQPWWDNLNKNSIQGPEPPKPLPPTGEGDLLLGERGYAKYVNIQKGERQRGELAGSGDVRGARATGQGEQEGMGPCMAGCTGGVPHSGCRAASSLHQATATGASAGLL